MKEVNTVSYVIYINWNKKQGMIHQITCHHAWKHDRLWNGLPLVDSNGASWWGPYNTYAAAREKADKIRFKVNDCSNCKPYVHA